MEAAPQLSPDEALELLKGGNRRLLDDTTYEPSMDRMRRLELAAAQRPFPAYLSCSDSRVPPKLLFERGLGSRGLWGTQRSCIACSRQKARFLGNISKVLQSLLLAVLETDPWSDHIVVLQRSAMSGASSASCRKKVHLPSSSLSAVASSRSLEPSITSAAAKWTFSSTARDPQAIVVGTGRQPGRRNGRHESQPSHRGQRDP